MSDLVNHPPHYSNCGTHSACGQKIEVIDVTEELSFTLGNAVKYLLRAGKKADALEDLKKARWYINHEIDRLVADSMMDAEDDGPICRVCGCTDDDCTDCLARTGVACHWVEPDLCSTCVDALAGECCEKSPNLPRFLCTRPPGHAGEHVAMAGKSECARWAAS